MRKLGLVLFSGLMTLPLASTAAAEEAAKITYKDGTRLEFSDFDIKFNVQLQPRYTYTDLDSEGRVEAGEDPADDSNSFRLRRARLIISGNVLENDQFSYKWQFDAASDEGGGEMKDAFIQWNGDPAKIRFGQFKVPYSRQELVSSSHLFFPDRSETSTLFTFDRDTGVMAHGGIGGLGHWYTGLFNGQSDGEGTGQQGVDTYLNWASQVDFSSPNFGSRGEEGDMRTDGSFGWTSGVSFAYGQGEGDVLGAEGADFERWQINGDVAMRLAGAELQGEVHHRSTELDDSTGDTGEEDVTGFYVQGTYIVEKIGVGARFGYIEPDDDIDNVDDILEYTAGLDYFIKGHNLKLQNAVTFEVENRDDDDITDFRYVLQLSGYF